MVGDWSMPGLGLRRSTIGKSEARQVPPCGENAGYRAKLAITLGCQDKGARRCALVQKPEWPPISNTASFASRIVGEICLAVNPGWGLVG